MILNDNIFFILIFNKKIKNKPKGNKINGILFPAKSKPKATTQVTITG